MKTHYPARNLITGGAGFIGSHLVDRLMERGEEVICVDNLYTGKKGNISKWFDHENFEFIRHDITEPIQVEIDKIWHFGCPASPIQYQKNPIKTSKTSFLGTYNMLGLARRTNAKFLMASTSEVYGDPKEHPQNENYFGNVNTIGERSCYDEGKRIAETLCSDYKRIHNLDIRIIRIFNTYGPRMAMNDGRVISNFITQALKGEKLTIYGKGEQTRSFCYIDDLIEGILKTMESNYSLPINLGNPSEFKIIEIANLIKAKINPDLIIDYFGISKDDPKRRRPNIDLAKEKLNWEPNINIDKGIDSTINYFKKLLNDTN